MPKIDRKFTQWMLVGFITDIFRAIFNALGRMVGAAFVGGAVGAVGGGITALIYGFPVIPWVIGGFVVCAIFAIVLIVFIASDL